MYQRQERGKTLTYTHNETVDRVKEMYKEYLQAMANLQCVYEAIFPDSTLPNDGLWVKNEETKLIINEIEILHKMIGEDVK